MKKIILIISGAILICCSYVFWKTHEPGLTSQESSVQKLSLEPTGLGVIHFGATPDEALPQLIHMLGNPTKDTGWIDSFSAYGTCPGNKIRVVEWNRLRLFFGDTTFGNQKFFQWEYTGRDTSTQTPVITTDKGVTLGMSKVEVLSLYPQAKISPPKDDYEYVSLVPYSDETKTIVVGTVSKGKVFWLSGGVQCGE